MENLRLLANLIRLTFSKFRQQIYLLPGLAVLFLLMVSLVGQGSEQLLSKGVHFSEIRLSVTGAQGDRTPEKVAQYLNIMEDVRQYCTVQAEPYEDAVKALEQGDVAAVVVLPKSFVKRVQWGENPAVRVIVSGNHPLEAMLLLQLGESACDFLSAVQAGIYAVIDLYEENPPPGLSHKEMVREINMEYVRWTMDRWNLFHEEKLDITGELEIRDHYSLSFLCFLLLTLAPIFAPVCQGSWLAGLRRLCWLGHKPAICLTASQFLSTLVYIILLLLSLLLVFPHPDGVTLWPLLLSALLLSSCSVICASSVKTLMGCGALSFFGGLAALFFAGGILPPVLLPKLMRSLMWLSPVYWARTLLAVSLHLTQLTWGSVLLLTSAVILSCLGAQLLYARRFYEEAKV